MKKNVFIVLAILALISFSGNILSSTKDEVLKLQEQVSALQKDVAEIKKLLQNGAARGAPQQPPRFEAQQITLGESTMLGDKNAPVTLIEYSDYQCPFCSRHAKSVMPTLISDYVDTGKLRYVMRENPIPTLHRQATNASLAALCARDQDKYWEMHDLLFDNQRTLDVRIMKGFAESLGLDTAVFNDCMDTKKYAAQIEKDITDGARLGVAGTPGFFIGRTNAEDSDKVELVNFIRGAQSLPNFQRAIDALLEDAD